MKPAPIALGLTGATLLAVLTTTPSAPPVTTWHARAAAEDAVRWTACPTVPVGCFAQAPGCVVSVCSCAVVCGRDRWRRVWERGGCDCGNR